MRLILTNWRPEHKESLAKWSAKNDKKFAQTSTKITGQTQYLERKQWLVKWSGFSVQTRKKHQICQWKCPVFRTKKVNVKTMVICIFNTGGNCLLWNVPWKQQATCQCRSSRLQRQVDLQVCTNILEKNTVSIFRAEDGNTIFLWITGDTDIFIAMRTSNLSQQHILPLNFGMFTEVHSPEKTKTAIPQ
jgi:hypothetical protein